MKPEGRSSFINRSFRRSFRRKKAEDDEKTKSPEEINDEHDKALVELKEATRDADTKDVDDAMFIRLLKGRYYDLKETEKLLRLFVNVQKFLLMEDYSISRFPEVVRIYGLGGVLGVDKEGHLIRLLNLGSADLKSFVHTLGITDLFRVLLYSVNQDLQAMKEENEKTGRNGQQMTYIVDLNHFSTNQLLYKPVIDTLIVALKLQRDFYCDIAKNVFIINAPSYYSSVLKAVKPAMTDHLRKAIKVLPNETFKETLLEHIDSSILPKSLGGTRTDSKDDPRCSEFLLYGGKVPDSYIYDPEKLFDPNDKEVQEVTIAAGSFLNIPIVIKELNVGIEYKFLSKEHDVGIAVFINNPGKEIPKDVFTLEQIVPLVRAQCNLRPVSDYCVPWRTGTYILHLDNTYSWMVPKQVQYKISVVPLQSSSEK